MNLSMVLLGDFWGQSVNLICVETEANWGLELCAIYLADLYQSKLLDSRQVEGDISGLNLIKIQTEFKPHSVKCSNILHKNRVQLAIPYQRKFQQTKCRILQGQIESLLAVKRFIRNLRYRDNWSPRLPR